MRELKSLGNSFEAEGRVMHNASDKALSGEV